jgi:hypothetical protein
MITGIPLIPLVSIFSVLFDGFEWPLLWSGELPTSRDIKVNE